MSFIAELGGKAADSGYHPWGSFSSEEVSHWKHIKCHIKHTIYKCCELESQKYRYVQEGIWKLEILYPRKKFENVLIPTKGACFTRPIISLCKHAYCTY